MARSHVRPDFGNETSRTAARRSWYRRFSVCTAGNRSTRDALIFANREAFLVIRETRLRARENSFRNREMRFRTMITMGILLSRNALYRSRGVLLVIREIRFLTRESFFQGREMRFRTMFTGVPMSL